MPNLASDLWCMPWQWWYRGENQIVYSKLRTNLSIIDKIEKAISKINEIKQACVIAKSRTFGSHTQQYLAAFYVLDSSLRQSQENKANKKVVIFFIIWSKIFNNNDKNMN